MAFRYEIWQYVEPLTGKIDDLHIPHYEKVYDVTPNDSGVSFEISRYENEKFYRVTASGDIIFSGNDYSTMYDIYNSNETYILLAFDTSTSDRSDFIKNNFWNLADYIGFLRQRSMVIDYDRCKISVTPDTFDIYTRILSIMDNEINLLHNSTKRTFGIDDSVAYQNPVETYFFTQTIVNGAVPDTTGIEFISAGDYFQRGMLVSLIINDVTDPYSGDVYHNMDLTYKREYGFTVSNTVSPSGSGWVLEWDAPQAGLYKWVRSPDNATSVTYHYSNPEPTTYMYLIVNVDFDIRARGVLLSDAIEHIIYYGYINFPTVNPYNVTSLFLDSATNPFTGGKNYWQYLMLVQSSDMKPTSDPATNMMISLSKVMGFIKYLNLYWYIEYDDVLSKYNVVIEHEKYFENGMSYSTQLTDISINEGESRLILSYESNPQKSDIFSVAFATTKDFIGLPIKYPVSRTSDSDNQMSFDSLTTDVTAFVYTPDNSPNDIVMMLQTRKETGVSNEVYYCETTTAYQTGRPMINGRLSIGNVQSDFWTYGRPTTTGYVNNIEVTFDSVARQRTQTNVPYKTCFKTFDAYKLVSSPLGIAEVKSASYSVKNNTFKLELLY